MSLSVYLTIPKSQNRKQSSGIFIRQNGSTVEVSAEEFSKLYSNQEPVMVVSDPEEETEEVYWANITHNLNEMAVKAGIYEALWRPYRLHPNYSDFGKDYDAEMAFESSVKMKAKDIVLILEKGLSVLKANPEYFKKFNSSKGWGLYKHFVPFVEKYLNACKEYPEAEIYCSR